MNSAGKNDDHRGAVRPEIIGLGSFLTGLGAVIDLVREAQLRTDRVAATRFSAFSYFKRDESILSGIIADLLSSDGTHGQGTTFLKLLLEEIDRNRHGGVKHRPGEDYSKKLADGCVVETEHVIPNKRRIDIVVRVGERSQLWLIIENKPWAGEQDEQLAEYVEYAHQQDAEACVLYLSGDGTESETIGDKKAYYRLVSYRDYRGGPSVERWIRRCAERCEADRVRWFLRDMLRYIQDEFHVEEIDYE